jgi:uncharacterized protein YbaP (TraB family)
MNVSRVAGLLAALMFAFVAPASARTGVAAAAPAQLRAVEPALFVARDADSTLYLFGTVHIRQPGADWGGANAHAALAESEEVWTELEITDDVQTRAAGLVLQHGMLPPGQTLSALLSPQENGRLQLMTKRLGVPSAMFERMRPWLAAITLSILPMQQAGYESGAGVDEAIDAAADAAGKRMRAFETIEQQIGFLANLSPELQRQMLVETLVSTEDTSQFDALSQAWERGNLEAMEAQVIDEMRDSYPEVYAVMFVQRNNAWIETLMRELDGAGVDFVAVGAGHMLGDDGLVAQLRARGVTVERVSPAE